MNRGIQPKNVAPLIRGARYTLLIAGWFYGSSKKAIYTKIEETARVKREAMLKEEQRIRAIKDKESDINQLKIAFAELGYEPEPDWEKILD